MAGEMTSDASSTQRGATEEARGDQNDVKRLSEELARTREALAVCEQELLDLRDQRSQTMARLERKAYWFEGAGIDPDAWMSRRPVRRADSGHGRTRNSAAEQARGRLLVFRPQDATPAGESWLSELIGPIDEDGRVGLSFGSHLPRAGTSPMVQRELEDSFRSFSPAE